MRILNVKRAFRFGPILALAAIGLALAGCGRTTETSLSQEVLATGAEPYIDAGPVTYQVQISRQLNPFSTSDVQYLSGVKNAQNLPGTDFWFGVFLWAKNQTSQTQETAGIHDMKLVDSAGNVYQPVDLNTSLNPYAWSAQLLGQNQTEPAVDSAGSLDSAQGNMLLFQLPQTVYSNRPLTLVIQAPGEAKPSLVTLDL